MCPHVPLFHKQGPMNIGIVVLEYARAIREEKIHWWDNLVIQYIQELCWLAVLRPTFFLAEQCNLAEAIECSYGNSEIELP